MPLLIPANHYGFIKVLSILDTVRTLNDVLEIGKIMNRLAPVVGKVGSAIHWINHYPLDSAIGFPNTYLMGSDLSDG